MSSEQVEEAQRLARELLHHLQASGIQARPLWRPLHRLPPYQSAQAYHVEQADRIYRDALSLPSSTGLSRVDAERVAARVAERAVRR